MKHKLTLVLALALPLAAQDEMARGREIAAEGVGIHNHQDNPRRVFYGHSDLFQRSTQGHVDFPRLREGGMHAPFFALWVPTYAPGAEAVRRTLDLRDAVQRVLDGHQDQIELATTAADIERIVKSG